MHYNSDFMALGFLWGCYLCGRLPEWWSVEFNSIDFDAEGLGYVGSESENLSLEKNFERFSGVRKPNLPKWCGRMNKSDDILFLYLTVLHAMSS